jgi:hypothetical protein
VVAPIGDVRWGISPTVQDAFLAGETVAEEIARDAEQSGCGRNVLAGLIERMTDQELDGFLEIEPLGWESEPRVEPVGGWGIGGVGGIATAEVRQLEVLVVFENQGAFEFMGQLANVAGPGIATQSLDRHGAEVTAR